MIPGARTIDLTQPFFHNGAYNPDLPLPTVEVTRHVITDGYRLEELALCTHVGTHMDAPSHVFAEGAAVDEYPPARLHGEAVCVDLAALAPEAPIDAATLAPYADALTEGSIALLRTGWGEQRAMTDWYVNRSPWLEASGARWLVERAFLRFVAHHGRVNAWMVERVKLLNEAERRLAHLAADAEALSEVADELRAELDGLRRAQVFDAPTLLGVDPELFARADAGDEDAMREMARQVVMRQGSASTDLRGAPGWRHAMLRHIGTSSRQSWADVLRSIEAGRAGGTVDPKLGAALEALAASFTGPGMAPASRYKCVRDALGDDEADHLAIDAFELYDEFQSDPDNFDTTHAEAGQAVGERLGDDGVSSCFVLIASTQWARVGDVARAMPLALRGLSLVAELHETDREYRDQLQRAATNARNFATYLGETGLADSLERTFGELIAEFESTG